MRVTNSKVSSITNATVVNCLALVSITDSECTNTVSPIFDNCTGDYNVSSNLSANFGANALTNQPISSWLDTNSLINETGQLVLAGAGSNDSNIIDWNYAPIIIITSTFNVLSVSDINTDLIINNGDSSDVYKIRPVGLHHTEELTDDWVCRTWVDDKYGRNVNPKVVNMMKSSDNMYFVVFLDSTGLSPISGIKEYDWVIEITNILTIPRYEKESHVVVGIKA